MGEKSIPRLLLRYGLGGLIVTTGLAEGFRLLSQQTQLPQPIPVYSKTHSGYDISAQDWLGRALWVTRTVGVDEIAPFSVGTWGAVYEENSGFIFIRDFEKNEVTVLGDEPDEVFYASPAPNGEYVAYLAQDSHTKKQRMQIWRRATGDSVVIDVAGQNVDTKALWSADSQQLYFGVITDDGTNHRELFEYSFDTKKSVQISQFASDGTIFKYADMAPFADVIIFTFQKGEELGVGSLHKESTNMFVEQRLVMDHSTIGDSVDYYPDFSWTPSGDFLVNGNYEVQVFFHRIQVDAQGALSLITP